MRQNIKYPKITVKHTAQNWRFSRQCPQVELKIFLERKDCEVGIFYIFGGYFRNRKQEAKDFEKV